MIRRRREPDPTGRELLRLAVPALGALIAEPLYILADTAIVGRLGTEQLAGLAVASTVLLVGHAVFIFLAYGTTAAVGRLLGAGREHEAGIQAVQGMWLAAGVGVVLAAVGRPLAEPLLRLLGAEGAVLREGLIYLRISLLGFPAMLVMLAGVGYLRGRKDTVRPLVVALGTALVNLVLESVLIFGFDQGIGASALSTVVAQLIGAGAYVVWVAQGVRPLGVPLRPRLDVLAGLARSGVHLFLRTAALRGSFTAATAVAARMGTTELAAHQIAFELWNALALGLDAIAIGAQAMVAHRLGAGDAAGARAVGVVAIRWGLRVGLVAGAAVLVLRPVLPGLFSTDGAVVALTGFLLLHLAVQQPLNGVVFALDGVLIGAGDLRFLAWAMAAAAAVFVPLAVLVGTSGAGIGWLWAALLVFMSVRGLVLLARFRTDTWARTA